MSLPDPTLDDLRFQRDLVDVARKRIIHYCPEWTDYNLSDPGITLIELFAWMTELITYRLNRVPDKNYINFLNMLGVRLQPPTTATTSLTFRLAAPFPLNPGDDTVALVPKASEVATRTIEEDEPSTIFTTDKRLLIIPPTLAQLRRTEDFHKNYLERLNVEVFYPFNRTNPREGDTFYIGFDEAQDISGHIIQLSFKCNPTQAPGIRRNDPPLVWECSLGDGRWEEIPPSVLQGEEDTTGGLNNEQGRITFYLPLETKLEAVYGREAYWIRCRFEQRRREQGSYTESPRITGVMAYALGASVPATHAVYVHEEVLGVSNGDPGQTYMLRNSPLLALEDNETVEVEEMEQGELIYIPWQYVHDFSASTRFDRHFTLDTATGEIRFGPAIRQRDGTVRQYGRIPEMSRQIRIKQYRYGGGVRGNVPMGEVQVMKSSLPYIDRVMNPKRASGGLDQEGLDEAKMRAQRELRAQERAVTAQDYEHLTKRISQDIARVKCMSPSRIDNRGLPPGMVELLIVPAVTEALQLGDLSKLQISEELVELIQEDLNQYRLLTTTLYIREPLYIGVKVTVEIVPMDTADPDLLRARVLDSLKNMLNPLPLKASEHQDVLLGEEWPGWDFGRDLYIAELFSLLQQIPGVKHVLDVDFRWREVIPANEVSPDDDSPAEEEEPLPLNRVERVVPVPSDGVICSLNHEVLIKYL